MQHPKKDLKFKEEVDEYFIEKYSQLLTTTKKIINKTKRIRNSKEINVQPLEAETVIAAAYLDVLSKEEKIKTFALLNDKTIKHVIYAFCLNYLNNTIYYYNSTLNMENKLIANEVLDLPEVDDVYNEGNGLDYLYGSVSLESNIYSEEFITGFYNSLRKLDAICFEIYYYKGINNPTDFAEHLQISKTSAYKSINRLKDLLKIYIKRNQII